MLPPGSKPKYDKGSWIVYDGVNSIYTHKAKYYDRALFVHEFYKYDIAGDSWSTLAGMPLYGLHSGRIKKKKAKDGGAGAMYERRDLRSQGWQHAAVLEVQHLPRTPGWRRTRCRTTARPARRSV